MFMVENAINIYTITIGYCQLYPLFVVFHPFGNL